MEQNIVHIQGMPVNFRDLGGIRTMDGKQVAYGRILRSGDLSGLSEEAAEVLEQQYHLRHILDLRTEEERNAFPDLEVPGAEYHVLDLFGKGGRLGGSLKDGVGSREQMEMLQDIEQVHLYMERLYRSYITTATVRTALKRLIDIFLETESGAVLFHCFAGKDRTGISAAVLLTVLGASKEDIMEDYLATNELRKEANRMMLAGLRKQMEAKGESDFQNKEKAVAAALNVDQRYLLASYETAEETYGSFENYIREGIGLSEEDCRKLRKLYLA